LTVERVVEVPSIQTVEKVVEIPVMKTLEGSTRYVDIHSVQRQLAETSVEEVVEQGETMDTVALEPIVVELQEVVVSSPSVDLTESLKKSVRRQTVTQEPTLQSVVYQPTSPTKRKSVAQPTQTTLYQSLVQPSVVQDGVTPPPPYHSLVQPAAPGQEGLVRPSVYQSTGQPAVVQDAVTQPTLYQSIVQPGVQEMPTQQTMFASMLQPTVVQGAVTQPTIYQSMVQPAVQTTAIQDGANVQETVTQPGMQYAQPGMQYMQPNLQVQPLQYMQPNIQFQAQPSGIQEGISVQETMMTQPGMQYVLQPNVQVQPLQVQPGMTYGQEGEGMQYMQADVQLQPPQLYT